MSSATIAGRTTQVSESTATSVHVGPGAKAMKYLTTTAHKVIGNMYFVTAFVFFGIGGLLALGIRAELARACLPKIWVDGRDC